MMSQFIRLSKLAINLKGQIFGTLTVLGPTRTKRYGTKNVTVFWLCQCICGSTKEVRGSDLRRGATKSCGCKRAESISANRRTHGQARVGNVSSEYKSWQDMKARCRNPKNVQYQNYGGRGIEIDPTWESFDTFFADMGPKPTEDHSIERIDNDAWYGPRNCRWATIVEQCKNKRTSRVVTYGGRTMIATDWAREVGLRPQILNGRLRDGWSIEAALFTPLQKNGGKKARRLAPAGTALK